MKARLSLTISIAATMLWSCQFDDVLSTPSNEGVIRVTSTLTKTESASGNTTNSPTNDNFKNGEIIYVWADKSGTIDDYIKAWELTATGTNGNFSGDSKAWPYDGSNLDFHAIHGNFNGTVTKNSTERDAEITHSVLTTQSEETHVRTSDLLYASKPNSTTGKTVELSFGHKLSKIVVKLVPSDPDNTGSGISETDLDNATVNIIGVKPDVKFNISAMAATTDGEAIDISLGSDDTNVREYECIVPPQDIAEGNEFIRITLKDEGRDDKRKFHYVIPTGRLKLEEGNKYIYTLTVKNYITAIPGVVEPWDSDSENPLEWKVMLFMPEVMPWNSENFSFEWRWITPNPDGVINWTDDNQDTEISKQ